MAGSWFIPDWMEAAWEVISRVLKLIWVVLTSCWHIIAVTCSVVVALWAQIKAALVFVVSQATAMWGILTDSVGSLDNALAAGWPPGLANGLAFANEYLPITEGIVMAGSLLTLYTFCVIIRVVKSWLPVVGT